MSQYPPHPQTLTEPFPTWEEDRWDSARFSGDVADARQLHALAAKDVRRYGVVLLICGALHAEMAMVFALTGWPIAALAAFVVVMAMLVGLAWWTNSRGPTLRVAAPASRLLWLGASAVWLLAHTLFFSASLLWIWWVAAVLLLGLGAGAYAWCRKLATQM